MDQPETLDLQDLRLSVSIALDMIKDDPAVVEAEVCASWCEEDIGTIHYTSEYPDATGQTPRSHITAGIGVVVILNDPDGLKVGFGSDAEDLSPDGVKAALELAKLNAQPTSQSSPFTHPDTPQATNQTMYDPEILSLSLDDLASLTVEALDGALSTFRQEGWVTHLNVDGHIYNRKEHFMLGNTHGLLVGETTTGLVASLLARLTREEALGKGHALAAQLSQFSPYEAGAEAARQALAARGGGHLESGDYEMILSPHAMTALMQDLLLPALCLDTVSAGASPFTDAFGEVIANPSLDLIDDGRLPQALGSRQLTGEGLPTGVTSLIEQGRLVGFLADVYHTQLLGDRFASTAPRNGLRYSLNNQSYAMLPGIFPTNLVLSSPAAMESDALIKPIANGLYIGELWNASPQGTPDSGNFVATVTGPSFLIQHGQRAQPLRPGVMQIQGNLRDLLRDITGISTHPRHVACANRQSASIMPEVRCQRIHLVA